MPIRLRLTNFICDESDDIERRTFLSEDDARFAVSEMLLHEVLEGSDPGVQRAIKVMAGTSISDQKADLALLEAVANSKIEFPLEIGTRWRVETYEPTS